MFKCLLLANVIEFIIYISNYREMADGLIDKAVADIKKWMKCNTTKEVADIAEKEIDGWELHTTKPKLYASSGIYSYMYDQHWEKIRSIYSDTELDDETKKWRIFAAMILAKIYGGLYFFC